SAKGEDDDVVVAKPLLQQAVDDPGDRRRLVRRLGVSRHPYTETRQVVGPLKREGQRPTNEARDGLRRAIVPSGPIADEAVQQNRWLVPQVLVLVFQPENLLVLLQEEVQDLDPLRLEVLAFVYDEGIELPLLGDALT